MALNIAQISGEAKHMKKWVVALCALALTTCAHPRARLSAQDKRICLAQGGYEDNGGFGEVFCQFRYSDGGKTCSGKRDCEGKCIVELGGSNPELKIGAQTTGQCESLRSNFGCRETVEGGKIIDSYCDD